MDGAKSNVLEQCCECRSEIRMLPALPKNNYLTHGNQELNVVSSVNCLFTSSYASDVKMVGGCEIATNSVQLSDGYCEGNLLRHSFSVNADKVSDIAELYESGDGSPLSPEVFASPSRQMKLVDSRMLNPPVRDLSCLRYIKVNQNHEKYPSWPVSLANANCDQSQPINTRSHSCTDHTNSSTEFPIKQRLAFQPGLRPLPERISCSEQREDISSKTGRNSSDPGLMPVEFIYDHYGKVVQKRPNTIEKFEDFCQKAEPGYLNPQLDSDGHRLGDQGYSMPSPPERDMVAAVGLLARSQRLEMAKKLGIVPHDNHSHKPISGITQHMGTQSSHTMDTTGIPLYNLLQHAPPTSFVDRDLMNVHSDEHNSHSRFTGVVHRAMHQRNMNKDDCHVTGENEHRQVNKSVIVRQTLCYNTSTQTDNVEHCSGKAQNVCFDQGNTEIQVTHVSLRHAPAVFDKYTQISKSPLLVHCILDSDQCSSTASKDDDKHSYVQHSADNGIGIQSRYASDDSGRVNSLTEPFVHGEQASIMRKLSKEFYGSAVGKHGGLRHSSSDILSHPAIDSSKPLAYSGTMSQADSYVSVVIHSSESVGLFGQDDSSAYVNSLRNNNSNMQRFDSKTYKICNSLENIVLSSSISHKHSKRFNSSSSVFHHKNTSTPVLNSKSSRSFTSLCNAKEASCTFLKQQGIANAFCQSSSNEALSASTEVASLAHSSGIFYTASYATSTACITNCSSAHIAALNNSGLSVEPVSAEAKQYDRDGIEDLRRITKNGHEADPRHRAETALSDKVVGRKPSMRKAYGVFEESEGIIASLKKQSSKLNPSAHFMSAGSSFDASFLDEIEEECDSSSLSCHHMDRAKGGKKLNRYPTHGNVSDSRVKPEFFSNDLGKWFGRMAWHSKKEPSIIGDRTVRFIEGDNRQSIDSGLGSDGQLTPLGPVPHLTASELRMVQQQAVSNFVRRKAIMSSRSSFVPAQPSPGTLSKWSSDMLTSSALKTLNGNLPGNPTRHNDRVSRSGSVSSHASFSDYIEMSQSLQPYRETEWRRLRRSGSYASNHSSSCSENMYEDIGVFATPALSPGQATTMVEVSQTSNGHFDDRYMMQSRVMASPNYQNVPVPVSKRRPLPPPPRSPSPERHGTPPALPPRKSFPCGRLVKHEAIGQNNSVDEAKIDFRSLMNQWQSNSPREDAYAARLRQQAIKLTGQRRQSSTSPFVSTDCVSSHTQHSVSTPSRKWRSSGSEGFMQFSKAISCDNLTGIISVTSQSKTSSELPLVNRKIATPARMAFNERSIPLSPQITLQNMKEVTQSSTGCSSDNGDLKFDVSTFSRLSLPVGGNPSSTSFSVNNYVNPGMYVDSSLQQKRNIGNNGVHRICPPYLSQATHLLNGRDDSTYRVETDNDLGNVNNSTRQARLCDHHTSSINLSDTVGSPSDWVHDGQAQDTVQLDSALQVEQRPDLSTNDCHNNAFPASTLGCHDAQMSSLCIDNTTSYCQKVSYQTTRCRHVCGANEPLLVSSDDESTPLAQRRSVKEHIIKLEHKASITSSPTSASDCTFLSPKYNPGSSGLPIFQENHPNVNSLSCASFIATDDRKTTGRLHDSSPSLSSSVCSYSFSEHTAASHLPELGTSVDSPLISANPCFLIDTQSSLTAYHTRVQGEPPMESLHHGSGCGFMHRGVVGLDACERPRSFSSLYMHGMSSHDVYRPNESVGMEPRRRQSDGNFLCTSKSADTGMTYPLCSTPNTFSVSHRRRPSQEELECDLQARELAAELATREKKLSDVLGTSAAKKRMQYMEGLFPENYFNCDGIVYNRQLHTDGSRDQCVAFGPQVVGGVQLERSVHCSTPSSIVAEVGHVWGASLVPDSLANETLTKQKEEMVKKIHRKVEFLKFEKQCLCEDIQAIDRLGNRVSDVVHQKCRSSSGCDKFHVYIEDMEKIVRLLLNLSGQLGRAESSVQSLAGGADRKILEMAVDKRDRLRLKHDEARRLKSDVDRRCQSVSAFLCQSLSESEMGDYHRFLQMKSKLMIDGQDLDDRITLGMVQIEELKRSIQEHSVPPATSRSSSSPASSGRSSSPPL